MSGIPHPSNTLIPRMKQKLRQPSNRCTQKTSARNSSKIPSIGNVVVGYLFHCGAHICKECRDARCPPGASYPEGLEEEFGIEPGYQRTLYYPADYESGRYCDICGDHIEPQEGLDV